MKQITWKLLEEALKYYYEKTQKKVTYEYVMLRDVNDSDEDAKNLSEIL